MNFYVNARYLCFICLSASLAYSCKESTKIDDDSVKSKVFRENCVSCHSFNSNKTAGGVTLRTISDIPKDSISIIYERAVNSEIHEHLPKTAFDTVIKR